MGRKGNTANDFWRRVDKTSGCWIWTGPTLKLGYGYLRFGGRKQRAHRVSYTLAIGPIPDGLLVCHKCDVRNCVNPDHLFLGSASDNTRDAMSKGRHVLSTKGQFKKGSTAWKFRKAELAKRSEMPI